MVRFHPVRRPAAAPMQLDHILLPIDGSPLSLRPLEDLPGLFEGRRVTLLRVVHKVPLYDETAPFEPARDEEGLVPSLAEAQASLEAAEVSVPASARVERAVIAGPDAGRAIARWARDNCVDLIALSTHGRSGLRRLVVGSVAESVLRHATVPVMAFPHKD